MALGEQGNGLITFGTGNSLVNVDSNFNSYVDAFKKAQNDDEAAITEYATEVADLVTRLRKAFNDDDCDDDDERVKNLKLVDEALQLFQKTSRRVVTAKGFDSSDVKRLQILRELRDNLCLIFKCDKSEINFVVRVLNASLFNPNIMEILVNSDLENI